MSTRTTFRPQPVITAGNMTGDITSLPTILQSLTRVSYQVTWSGSTPVGTVSAQVSNTYALATDGTTKTAGTWSTIPLQLQDGTVVTSVPITGNTGNIFLDIISGAYAVRILYTHTSGTGSMDATVDGKVS